MLMFIHICIPFVCNCIEFNIERCYVHHVLLKLRESTLLEATTQSNLQACWFGVSVVLSHHASIYVAIFWMATSIMHRGQLIPSITEGNQKWTMVAPNFNRRAETHGFFEIINRKISLTWGGASSKYSCRRTRSS